MHIVFRKKTALLQTVAVLLLLTLPVAPAAQIVESVVTPLSSPSEDKAAESEATALPPSSADSLLAAEGVSSEVQKQSVDAAADSTALNSELPVASERNNAAGFYGESYRGGRAPQMRGVAVEPQAPPPASETTARELMAEKPQIAPVPDSVLEKSIEQPQAAQPSVDTALTRHHIRPFELVAGIVGVVVIAGGAAAMLLAQKQKKSQESAFPDPPPVPEY